MAERFAMKWGSCLTTQHPKYRICLYNKTIIHVPSALVVYELIANSALRVSLAMSSYTTRDHGVIVNCTFYTYGPCTLLWQTHTHMHSTGLQGTITNPAFWLIIKTIDGRKLTFCRGFSSFHTSTWHNMTWHDTTRHDTTRHDTTRHDTTHHITSGQDRTRQNRTEHHAIEINIDTPNIQYMILTEHFNIEIVKKNKKKYKQLYTSYPKLLYLLSHLCHAIFPLKITIVKIASTIYIG